MCGVDRERHERREGGETKVLGDELGHVREESAMEQVLDAGDIHTSVLGERMVAVDQEGEDGKCAEQERPARRGPRLG